MENNTQRPVDGSGSCSPAAERRILLIEPDAAEAGRIQGQLSEITGFKVSVVGSACDALERVGRVGFDCVLLDLKLRQGDGYEPLVRLRDAALPFPVVVLAGEGDDATGLEAIRLGARDYLRKEELDARQLARAIGYAIQRHSTEETLHAQNERLHAHLEHSPMGVIEWDKDWRFTVWAGAAERIFGWQAHEILGRPVRSFPFVYKEDLEAVDEVLARLGEGTARYVTSVNRNYTKSGRVIHCEWHNTVLRDSAGHTTYVMSLVSDITQRMEAERALVASEARFRSIFTEAATPTALTRPDGTFVKVNQAYCDMLGYTEQEVMDTTFIEMTHPDDREATTVRAVGRLMSGEVSTFKTKKRYIHKNGSLVWCNLSVSLLKDPTGDDVYFLAQYHDITARQAAEAEIVRLNEDLELRVAQRTAELSQALDRLKAESEQRARLESEILNVSEREQSRIGQDLHDGLGQELAGVAMLARALSEKLAMKKYSEADMALVISNLTSAAIESARRLARGLYPVELKRYGLLKALEELVANQSMGVECRLKVSVADLSVAGPAEIHLYRIVQESISNAIKHGKATLIEVEVGAADGLLLLQVRDNGIGFQPCTEGPRGLGLEFMDYRARLIGATLTVGNAPGGGCQVVCRGPALAKGPDALDKSHR